MMRVAFGGRGQVGNSADAGRRQLAKRALVAGG